MSEVDHEKYPDVKQKYRFELQENYTMNIPDKRQYELDFEQYIRNRYAEQVAINPEKSSDKTKK